ncbi:HNH endonuclease [Helicobacter pylori]|uniref:HNH endonuclease signature motif containing protein n=1 Tax=Helicobacter pylori TaxID=210 RepID=UPI000378D301|nr:HNH endonuclease [Helicobacter pylori]EQL74030.1 5-amino-6-(5-phosphoribosylamino)uracil reductase [Helicobacter pylori FD719]
MAEWKTDTEEVKQIVKACRDFKRSLQEERCAPFIKNLDGYAQEILLERKKIEHQLQGAREELKKAKSNEKGARLVLRGLQFASGISSIWPPSRIAAGLAVAAAEMALKIMEEDTEKWKKNVELLVQALEIYSTQAKASAELVEGAWEGVKKALWFYTDKHQEFIKRLNKASEAIDNGYNIAPPEILKESDFESPVVIYNPKKSAFDERLKDLREDFSFSLYADLKNRFQRRSSGESDRTKAHGGHGKDLMSGTHSFDGDLSLAKKHCVKNCKKALQDFTEKIKKSPNDLNAINEAFNNLEIELERATENLSQKIAPVLERYENYKKQALGYGEFLEKEKEGFIVDEQNPYPEEVRFNELRLAEFESVFSVIVPLEDLDKTACAHHALKALEAALKNRDLGFDATELEQIAKGFIPKGYLWHFDANVLGNLALVREELLLSVKHTKGYLLWKQFLQTQN